MMNQTSPGYSGPFPADIGRLQAEIAHLECRVQQLNEGWDSACEKALIRSYEALLEDRRLQLAALHAA